MQLKVIKADGSVEEYLHTKVMATLSNALGSVGRSDAFVAEQLAEAATFFLYHDRGRAKVTSGDILAITKGLLSSTGHEDAAAALSDHSHQRDLVRRRIEVVKLEVRNLSDAEELDEIRRLGLTSRWNKSQIVADLIREQNLPRATAKVIASMVEDKIVNSQFRYVSCSLIKELVLSDTVAVLNAGKQLGFVASADATLPQKRDPAGKDSRLRQRQNGLCPVEV